MRRIRIDLGGVHATAALHDELAPATSDRLWASLPLEGTLRHVRWSGAAGYLIEPRLQIDQPEPENAVSIYPPGSITLRTDHGELGFAYGEAQARDARRIGARACHLATLDDGASAFLAQVAACLHEGGKQIRVDRETE